MTTYYYVIDMGDRQLRLAAADDRVDPVRLSHEAELLAAAWNARYDARHCDGHEWGDPFELDPDVFGHGQYGRACSKCLVTEDAWEIQKEQEGL